MEVPGGREFPNMVKKEGRRGSGIHCACLPQTRQREPRCRKAAGCSHASQPPCFSCAPFSSTVRSSRSLSPLHGSRLLPLTSLLPSLVLPLCFLLFCSTSFICICTQSTQPGRAICPSLRLILCQPLFLVNPSPSHTPSTIRLSHALAEPKPQELFPQS